MATTAIVIGIIGVLAAGGAAYMQSEAAAEQARGQKRMAKHQAEAERAAGDARRRQVEFDTQRKMRSFRSREAAAGVQIGEGSLLEQEMQFASDSEYAAQIAQYPHTVRADIDEYQGRLFGSQERRINQTKWLNTGLAAAGTGASAYGAYAGRGRGSTLSTGYGNDASLGPTATG
jgi:type II secretory pathway pseudopilin PulG